ncbi:hypothetical protein APHAL10511_008469 [Amanita phalloides]|nr:hypothetical protein APHAL10511_008469 [Amanita phalloides]
MILSTPEPASGINYDYQEVKSLESRAGTLDISASLAVSILSGAFIAAGMGSYLDRRDDSSGSHTIAVTAHIRTKTERLDIPDNNKFIRLAGEQIQQNGATHVITAIEYGGHIVLDASLERDGKIFEVNGEAVLNLEDKKKLAHFDCEVRLLANIYLKSVLPTNAFEVLAVVMRANQAIGEGVPLNVYLTSLKRFKDRFSAVSLVQQLDTAQLNEVLHFYDKYITLNQDRAFLREQMDQQIKSYFPSFTASYLRPGSTPNADLLTDADNTLLLLDDAIGTLIATIKRIRESKETGFLTFGVVKETG